MNLVSFLPSFKQYIITLRFKTEKFITVNNSYTIMSNNKVIEPLIVRKRVLDHGKRILYYVTIPKSSGIVDGNVVKIKKCDVS
jgi:hypothetical protein